MSGFVLHPGAFSDLEEIWEYIAVDNLDAADRLLSEIGEAMDTLAKFPEMGFQRAEISSRPLRFHMVRDFVIAYAPDEKPLLIIGVMHGRRSPRVLGAILRDRQTGP